MDASSSITQEIRLDSAPVFHVPFSAHRTLIGCCTGRAQCGNLTPLPGIVLQLVMCFCPLSEISTLARGVWTTAPTVPISSQPTFL